LFHLFISYKDEYIPNVSNVTVYLHNLYFKYTALAVDAVDGGGPVQLILADDF